MLLGRLCNLWADVGYFSEDDEDVVHEIWLNNVSAEQEEQI